MEVSSAQAPQSANRLLASLSTEDFERLQPHLERVALPLREVLIKAGAPAEFVYFPERGMVSLVQPLSDGATIEIGMIGNEGLAGAPAAFGIDALPMEAMVQIAGSALRMSAAALREEVARNPALQRLLLRYSHALFAQVSQSAACNGRHTLEERLARWLLMAADYADDGPLRLSHEFMAMMLAVRRAGVTVAAGALKHGGFIGNTHGRIQILDRKGLEEVACECYRAVKNEYQRLLA